jgi:hypothetical protein
MLKVEFAWVRLKRYFLDNYNLIYSLEEELANIGNTRETSFLNQMRMNCDVIVSKLADLEFNDISF